LDALLAQSGRTFEDAAKDRKGVPWNVDLAAELRRSTTATSSWIARQLSMGSTDSVSVHLSMCPRSVPI
jgi:hypothetical protein